MHVHHARISNSKQGSATALEPRSRGNAWEHWSRVAVALWKCQLPGITSVPKAARRLSDFELRTCMVFQVSHTITHLSYHQH